MGTKIKGIRKGFNKYISHMFVKEEDIQISGPTDVKHVAHIGWDGGSGSNPSWMNEFDTGPNFAMTSVAASASTLSPWTSKGLSQDTEGMGEESERGAEVVVKEEASTEDVSLKPKKQRRRKKKKCVATSSPRAAGGVKPKSRKPKSKLIDANNATAVKIAMP